MPISIEFDRGTAELAIRAWDVVTDEDLLGFLRDLASSIQLESGIRMLADLREIERVEISNEELRRFGSEFRTGAVERMAFVASTELSYGLARMYQMRREDEKVKVEVFRDVGEAEAWLQQTHQSEHAD